MPAVPFIFGIWQILFSPRAGLNTKKFLSTSIWFSLKFLTFTIYYLPVKSYGRIDADNLTKLE